MLTRVLEPEVMDSVEEAADYDAMDHAEVNRRFVDDFLMFWRSCADSRGGPGGDPAHLLDVGTGTAQIPIELCRRPGTFDVLGIDLAAHMLQLGQRNVERAGFQQRIRLECMDAKQMPCPAGSFDAVISNSIVHHIPQPVDVFREMLRVTRPGGLLFIRDLLRPPDQQTLRQLVDSYAAGANAHQRQMFGDSLHAALSLDEVRQLLTGLGQPAEWAVQTSDRHWTIAGQVR